MTSQAAKILSKLAESGYGKKSEGKATEILQTIEKDYRGQYPTESIPRGLKILVGDQAEARSLAADIHVLCTNQGWKDAQARGGDMYLVSNGTNNLVIHAQYGDVRLIGTDAS